jgi:hypothetical protein
VVDVEQDVTGVVESRPVVLESIMRSAIATILIGLIASISHAQTKAPTQLPGGYWTEAQSAEILAKTEIIRLETPLDALSEAERSAIPELLEVGALMHVLYERSRHAEARTALSQLTSLHERLGKPVATRNLLDLYRLYEGPIATTLDNRREAFLPVAPQTPARNVYPRDATVEQIDKFLTGQPLQRAEILGERSVVRRATQANLAMDSAALKRFALVRELHPGWTERLQALTKRVSPDAFYAVPYSIAYADELTRAFALLMRAADKIQPADAEFSRYLRNRARDLVSDDYEAGDASWVTGRFVRLNAQIGSYETYDDALYGMKAFHSMSILLRDEAATKQLREALGGLQAIEDALPYEKHKRVREDIPVGVYDVIADFGQARGINTATILPNDALFSRRYGRTILLRANLLKNPVLFASDERVWRAATTDTHANDLAPEGNLQRTLWHEVGHYLGPDRDQQGRPLDEALANYADAMEEMKSDLVSLFALHRMQHPSLRAIQASGIRRTLQNVKPRTDQPYQTMQLVQFNWFLERGLLRADPATARLMVDYDRYLATIESLLKEVLRLQYAGDKDAVGAFFKQWTTWAPELHEKLAERVRAAQGARFRIVRYGALGE